MNIKGMYDDTLAEYSKDIEYLVCDAKITITSLIVNQMDKTSVSKLELAERLGITPCEVSKILNCNTDMTLHDLVKIFNVLNCRLEFFIKEE
jgi:transcriptional regulator with XRE-family HTH domain